MSIGTKIRKLRIQNKLSQPELASKLNISQTALSEIESGKTKKVDFLLMDKVCNVFEVNFDYFLEDKKVFKIKNNTGVAVGDNAIINTISEKLIEQYEMRIAEKDDIIKELKKLLQS